MTVLALTTAQTGLASITDPSPEGADPIAQIWLENPIMEGTLAPAITQDLICWSGWCGERFESGGYAPHVGTWTAQGWNSFERIAQRLDAAAARAGTQIIFRPHARHVLADPQSTLAWLKRTELKNTRVLLDPAAWLTPSMLEAAEDHLARAFESFTGHPAVWGTVLTGLREAESGELIPCPWGQGVLPAQTVLDAIGDYPLNAHPVVLLEEHFEAQKQRLTEMLAR